MMHGKSGDTVNRDTVNREMTVYACSYGASALWLGLSQCVGYGLMSQSCFVSTDWHGRHVLSRWVSDLLLVSSQHTSGDLMIICHPRMIACRHP